MIAGQQDSMGIQAALLAQGRVLNSIRSGEPATTTRKVFPKPTTSASAVTWSLPSTEGCRYVALQGLQKSCEEWLVEHQIVLLDLVTGSSASLSAVDLEWVEWIPPPVETSPTDGVRPSSPRPDEAPAGEPSPCSPSAAISASNTDTESAPPGLHAIRPDPTQPVSEPAANTSEHGTGPRLLVCVRSRIFRDGMMATLLMYQWDGSSRPALIWEQPHRRFQHPGSLTRSSDLWDLHLSPDHRLLLFQGPQRDLQIIDVSAPQIGSPRPLSFAHCHEHGVHMPSALSEVSLMGWSSCGRLVGAICSCPVQDSISAAACSPRMTHSFLHVWHAASASLLVGLDLAHAIFGSASSRFDLQNLGARWAPGDRGKNLDVDGKRQEVHPLDHGQQVSSLAVVHAGPCWNPLDDEIRQGVAAGCILRVLAPDGPGKAADRLVEARDELDQAADRPAEAADGLVEAADELLPAADKPMEAAAVRQQIPMDLGAEALESMPPGFQKIPPRLEWLPEGSHVWVDLGSRSCLLDQWGRGILSATNPGLQPPSTGGFLHDGGKHWEFLAEQPDLCWTSPCKKVLVKLFLLAGMGLYHCDAHGEHQVQVELPMPGGLLPIIDKWVSFAWQPASSSSLIYAFAVCNLGMIVDACRHTLLQRIQLTTGSSAAIPAALRKFRHISGLQWSPDGRALSMQFAKLPNTHTGPIICQVMHWKA